MTLFTLLIRLLNEISLKEVISFFLFILFFNQLFKIKDLFPNLIYVILKFVVFSFYFYFVSLFNDLPLLKFMILSLIHYLHFLLEIYSTIFYPVLFYLIGSILCFLFLLEYFIIEDFQICLVREIVVQLFLLFTLLIDSSLFQLQNVS